MKTHSIRLNGPWQFQTTPAPSGADSCANEHDRELQEGVIRLPTDWPAFLAGHRGSHFAFSRSFNFPATLAENEICELCFERLATVARVILNESLLTPSRDGQSAVCEIKVKLQPSNRLQIRFTQALGEENVIPFENVSLRIRPV